MRVRCKRGGFPNAVLFNLNGHLVELIRVWRNGRMALVRLQNFFPQNARVKLRAHPAREGQTHDPRTGTGSTGHCTRIDDREDRVLPGLGIHQPE